MKVPFRLMLAHARKSWQRTLLTAGSVFVAVFIFGALRTIVVGMERALEACNESRIVTSSAISLFAHIPSRLYPEIKSLPGVKCATHWTWYGGKYIDEAPEHNMWARFGVEVPTFRVVYGGDLAMSDEEWKKFETTRTGCIIGKDLAESEKLKLGSKVKITGTFFRGIVDLEVVGIYTSNRRSRDQKTLFFNWDYMNEASKEAGGVIDSVSTFTMLLDDPSYANGLMERIDKAYESSANRTRTLQERQFQAQFNSMWGGLPLFFALIGGAALVASLMVTANTMVLNARERVQEIGVLKTLGFTPRAVGIMTLIEGILICLLGGGLALLLVLGCDGKQFVFIIMGVPKTMLAEGLAITLGLGLLSGMIPAIMSSRLDIVTAIRRRA